ncbi:hypothetical protein HMPREF3227_00148 [Corynebacterium sp. CMW7794]|nr:hypothetical protein HMPREF0307_01718 [Corynebacterium sp. DNF00584]KXI19984.1 hypothetical protein HMPREF3227_00148 [Corynebacterium sp. CMW7794]
MVSYTWRSRIDSQQVDNYDIEFLGGAPRPRPTTHRQIRCALAAHGTV